MLLFVLLSCLLYVSCVEDETTSIIPKRLVEISETSNENGRFVGTRITTLLDNSSILERYTHDNIHYDTANSYIILKKSNFLEITPSQGSAKKIYLYVSNGMIDKIIMPISYYSFPYTYDFTETRLFKRDNYGYPKDFVSRFNGFSPHRIYENGLHSFVYVDGKLVQIYGYPEDTTLDYFASYPNLKIELFYQSVNRDLMLFNVNQINNLILQRFNFCNTNYYIRNYFINILGYVIYNQPNNLTLVEKMNIFNGYQNITYHCDYLITDKMINKIFIEESVLDANVNNTYEISLFYQ